MSEHCPTPEPSPEERLVEQAIARLGDKSEQERRVVDRAARIITAWYHGGQASALYSFQSTGAIDRERMEAELSQLRAGPDATDLDRRNLDFLSTYLFDADDIDELGNRPPVDDWHERTRLWEPGS